MSVAIVNTRLDQMTSKDLFAWLTSCPDPLFESVALEIARRFCRALGRLTLRLIRRVDRGQQIAIPRPDVMLRGFEKDELQVLLLASEDESWSRADSAFWSRVISASELPIIIAASEPLADFATARVRGNFALVLTPSEVCSVLDSPNGLSEFKRLLRQHFSLTTLHPFDDHHPVTGPMFRGREHVLDKLLHQDRSNFALIGPSKMGKTSLVHRYEYLFKKLGKSGRQIFYKSLYEVPPSDKELVRAIRMTLDPNWNAYYDDIDVFPQFLRKFVSRQQMVPELILDEVDAHVGFSAIKTLEDLAQQNLLRLILIGRWKLSKACLHTKDNNILRLQPLWMEPLTIDEAEDLIARPLADMGIGVSKVHRELRSAANQCGRVPGHLHEFGQYLVESAQSRKAIEISEQDVQLSLARIVRSVRVNGLIQDLSTPLARASALLIILNLEKGLDVNPLWLQERLQKLQIRVGVETAWEICDELVIHHLLGCPQNDEYRVGRWDFVAEGQRRRKFFEAMFEEHLKKAREEALCSRN